MNCVICLVTHTQQMEITKLRVLMDGQTTVILFLFSGQYSRAGVTKQWPNLAHHLFLDGLSAKYGFYIFKCRM